MLPKNNYKLLSLNTEKSSAVLSLPLLLKLKKTKPSKKILELILNLVSSTSKIKKMPEKL
jgi:hypothetical protein